MTKVTRNGTLLLAVFLAACQAQAASPFPPTATVSPTVTDTPAPTLTSTPAASATPIPTLFPLSVGETPVVACEARRPAPDDLFPIVTAAFGLDRRYIPPDLVRLGDYLPDSVTLPDMLLRQEAAAALGELVSVMRADGLKPTVLSAYRSYADQVVSHNRWVVEDPANAGLISAQPGHSEHQLGTAVDFGSPELPALTGSTTDKFSPLFSRTAEGLWLEQHAWEYGFTLTNPPDAQPWTGLAYEPWHYRFVGVDLAAYLPRSDMFLTEYLFRARPGLPCIP